MKKEIEKNVVITALDFLSAPGVTLNYLFSKDLLTYFSLFYRCQEGLLSRQFNSVQDATQIIG